MSNTNGLQEELSHYQQSGIDSIIDVLPKLGENDIMYLQSKVNLIVENFSKERDQSLADLIDKWDYGTHLSITSTTNESDFSDIDMETIIEEDFTKDQFESFYKHLESPSAKRKKKVGLYTPQTMNILSDRYVFSIRFEEVFDSICSKMKYNGFVIDELSLTAIVYMAFIIPCISYDKEDQEFLTYKYMGYETMYCSQDNNGNTFYCSCEPKLVFLDIISNLAIKAYHFLYVTTKWQNDIIPAFDFFEIHQLFVDSRLTNLGGKNTNSPWQQFLKTAKCNCNDVIVGIMSTQVFPEKNMKLIQGIVTFRKHESCCTRLMKVAFKPFSIDEMDPDVSNALFVSRDNHHAQHVYGKMGFRDSDLHKYSDFNDDKTQDDEMQFMIMA